MGRKRNPYLPLYTRDIMSSPRCRALSCQATGVYLWLLCRLNEPPQPGAFRLSDWEAHPTWKRSLTQQCLAEADKQRRLQYFARYLAKNDLPWDRKEVLDGLQELYRMGIVVVEGDMLVQPRMYKDNGFELPDLDGDGDPEGTILDDRASGSMASKEDEEFSENNGAEISTEKGTRKGTEKVQRKAPVSHAGARLNNEFEIENNINNSKGNIGGVGEIDPQSDETFWVFWDAYDYKTGNRSAAAEQWALLTEDERAAAMEAIPAYCDKHPVKKYRKTPCDFLRERFWERVSGNIPPKSKNAKFSPPTLEEVQAYCTEKQYTFDAVMFWNHYEANGWVQGKGKPIKSWQACCNTWQRRESNGEFTNNNSGNNGRKATTNNQRGAYQGAGRNQEQEAAALREQTVRLIERNRAQRAAAQADGTDTGDDPF